jgi:putative heme-binding domain-containing protein
VKDLALVRRIIDTHKTIPAVNLHCAMHSFRTGTDDWFKFLGIQSSAHGPQEPIALTMVDRAHPITATQTDWTTIKEELYNNIFIFDGQALIRGKQIVPGKAGAPAKEVESVVAWTNEKQGARSFSTTIGHNNETVSDPRYLDLVVRGLLWACNKLEPAYLTPFKGENKITFIKATPPPPAPKKVTDATPAVKPADANSGVAVAPAPAIADAKPVAAAVKQTELPAPVTSANAGDPFKAEGNVTPKIVKLTPEQEAAILKDVKIPEGFDVTLFANAQAANYPVFVAAAPNGDLYVSSDGNGSLGRSPHRGRVLRLRDTDGDGRADQVTEFVKDVDSPRGLVWDHDRLYLIHPPDVSVYIDRDGDGVAEESKTLIKGIAFGFADRPADHTTNGLSIGIDGWLYVAGGDFGFMDAVGTDGRHVQHRGGGVLRFRPDGSGLEIFSRGTRNIVEVAVGPKLEIFARDNTNDGGGWDIRFENFTGLEHHGYPYLYKNFGPEHVQPLADYGGGSGCGALYLDEPGFGKWNGPATCDWGTAALWHHSVKPAGGSFVETAPPEKFIGMTRPTDADVDALSHVYQASWKGPATFNWAGTDVGYIVRVTPKDFTAPALPDFDRVSDAELVKLLNSPSHRTRLAAQRTLLRRADQPATKSALLALAGDKARAIDSRVAALFALTQRSLGGSVDAAVEGLASDVALQPYLLRALADVGYVTSVEKKTAVATASFAAGLKSPDAHVKLEAIVGAVHQNMRTLAPQIAALLGDDDARVAHTAFRGLAVLEAHEAGFAVLDSTTSSAAQRAGATFALQLMHSKAVVDGVLARLARETSLERRKGLLSVLCRLNFTDGAWKGDSWGTRPDTRGPYYQPETWSESERIGAAIKDLLAKASPAEAGFLVGEMNRNRIQSNEALERIIALAAKDPALAPDAVAQMATVDDIPKDGIPLLVRVARDPASRAATLAQVITALAKTDSADGARAMLVALVALDGVKGSNKEQETGRTAFNNATRLDTVHEALEDEAAKVGTPTAAWAEAALLKLSSRPMGSPEARDSALKAITQGWENPARRVQIIRAADKSKSHAVDDKILAALEDPAPDVARAARAAVASLRLERRGKDTSPLLSTLKPEEIIAQVVKTKGDAALGEQLFVRQSCVSCHTVTQNEVQKGPYLGNIAQTYTRPELAQNIIDPNKTIAQGFATELIKLKDGSQQLGFITLESADNVKLRNTTSQEFTFAVKDISERQRLPISVMPPGLVDKLTVREFASLLDYLEALAKK